MGTDRTSPRPTSLADALFTKTQQRLFAYIFGQPNRSFHGNELIRLTRSGHGAVQRELARLAESGLVNVQVLGRQKQMQANPASPLFAELTAIARKTFGMVEPLRAVLEPLKPALKAAFVYGSVARGEDSASSDIDLFMVSDKLEYADVYPLVEPLTADLGRVVNPTIYTRQSLRRALAQDKSFVKRVLSQPKLWIVGSEDELGTRPPG